MVMMLSTLLSLTASAGMAAGAWLRHPLITAAAAGLTAVAASHTRLTYWPLWPLLPAAATYPALLALGTPIQVCKL